MSDRDILRHRFLEQNGWGGVECPLLAGDASFRKYYRLQRGEEQVVLMDAPPPQEDVRPFVKIADFLVKNGFSAPRIFAQDVENGFLLIEDLGDDTYTRLLNTGHDEQDLYKLATEVLIDLHKNASDLPEALPPYDQGLLLRECMLLPDWWMIAAFGEDGVDAKCRQSYQAAWASCLSLVQEQSPVLVLRDYHVDNLLLLPQRKGQAACGLLDFQDAVAGHPAYDLMSLLEDARRDIEPSLIETMKNRYIQAFPDMNREKFDAAFAILGAQRHAKVIGIFARLYMRDDKPIYLQHIPRVWRLLERALEHPALCEVKNWFDRNIPHPDRGIPPCLRQK